MNKKTVGIIGAGVSGLATAKVFLSQGHAVTVFDKAGTLGGVWTPARRHPGLRLQTVRDCYAFSDFPMPSHYPEFPSGAQIYDYLVAYATHFGIAPNLRLSREVTRLAARPDGRRGWRLHVRDLATGAEEVQDFDFVVVCNGVFSEPNIPQIPGRDTFEANGGTVMHSAQVPNASLLDGRRVVVVGFGKSALDIAEYSVGKATSVAIVARRIPWKVPHRIWGKLHIKYFVLSRFTEVWYPNPRAHGLWRRIMGPLAALYWRLSERIIGRQLGLTAAALRPEVSLRKAGNCITLAPDNLRALRDGRIALHRGGLARFTASGLKLDTGEEIAAQTVIMATGFKQDCPFLEARERAALFDERGDILLYRLLINPRIPDLAFNGYNGIGSCQLTAEAGACWLTRYLDGRIALPSADAMEQDIRDEIAFRRDLLDAPHGVGFYASPLTMAYLDTLLADMGLPPADRHRRFFDWLFTPIDPRDYRDLLARSGQASPRQTAGGEARFN
jgi:cation diffusion facilitator CzcD-associated flavoprotein CzcO